MTLKKLYLNLTTGIVSQPCAAYLTNAFSKYNMCFNPLDPDILFSFETFLIENDG